jgi:hypothetical protein
MPPVFRLRSIAGRCHCHLLGQQYETCNPQQRVLSLGTKILKQSRWPYVHGWHQGDPHKQGGGIKYFANYQSSDVIGRRGQTWCAVCQRQNGSVHTKDTQRNGTLTITHSHLNQQIDRTCTTHQQDPPQSTEGHGHAILMVTLSQRTGPV